MDLKLVIGSGDRIGRIALPVLAIGLASNVLQPSLFSVGGPPAALAVLSGVVLAAGLVNWIWSAALILTKVPQRRLITEGPFALVKHPLYTGMALLVLPWLGFLLNSWLGVLIGAVIYVASRRYAPEEEKSLAKAFGARWDAYSRGVAVPWL